LRERVRERGADYRSKTSRDVGDPLKQALLKNAKSLRTHQTDAEKALWYQLRGGRFCGLKFKRQVPIDRYIVDFVCFDHKVVIELDGGHHADQVSKDLQRDLALQNLGYLVLRYWNNQVLCEMPSVLEAIRLAIESQKITS
jgi:very-short-patch-repair endonuclease